MKITNQQLSSIPFRYAQDVRDGKILVGKRIKQAVDRFYFWLENCPEHVYLDHEKGMQIINFFSTFLNHTKGLMAGEPFVLAPFQQFTLYNVFGWQKPFLNPKGKIVYNEDGTIKYVRRIRKVYDKRARGNGKTAEMAGICLNMISFEMESEAEVYIAATKEDQAKICWRFARNYIEHPFANKLIKKLGFQCLQNEIRFTQFASIIKPLGRDSKTQDGLSVSFGIIDEYHAHPSDDLLEVIASSMVKRLQPLIYIITTAGVTLEGVCHQFEKVCIDILEGIKKDDSLWIMIHELDQDDDWEDKTKWEKANPLWNYGLNVAELMSSYTEAVNHPSKQPNFKTKHLNMWVDALTVWISQDIWDKGNTPIIEENFKKFGCTGALDLSAVTDFTAFAIMSEPDDNDIRDLKVYLFCPKQKIRERSKIDRVPYQLWIDQGYIIATKGNVVDYNVLEEIVVQEYIKHQMKWVEFDRKFSELLVQNLIEKNINLSPFSQTIMEYTNPTKQFERLLYGGKIRHGGNPVLRWMLGKCVAIEDTNENIRISKKHSTGRIDGIIASIMALGGSLTPEDTSEQSQYNDPKKEMTFGL